MRRRRQQEQPRSPPVLPDRRTAFPRLSQARKSLARPGLTGGADSPLPMESAADAARLAPRPSLRCLRDLIVQGLAPGSRIVETEIATRLGVVGRPCGGAAAPPAGRLWMGRRVRSAAHRGRSLAMTSTSLLNIVGALEGMVRGAAPATNDEEISCATSRT